MGGTGFDYASSITLDPNGNIYTTGDFEGTVDFDPEVGIANLTSAGGADIFISKLIYLNEIPTLTTISPTSATEGDSDFTITATGTDFISSSTIDWDGTPLTTTYVSATELTANVPSVNLNAGTANVTVTSPTPGGGTTAPQIFTINARPSSSSSSGSRPKTTVSTPEVIPTLTETTCPQGDKYSSTTGLPCTSFTPSTSSGQATTCLITLTLRQGNTGEQVKCLQTKLNITSDGIFGPMTKGAVMLFQKEHNLVQDGIVGPVTRGAL